MFLVRALVIFKLKFNLILRQIRNLTYLLQNDTEFKCGYFEAYFIVECLIDIIVNVNIT